MTVLAIDPGPEFSAWVLWQGDTRTVHGHGKEPNQQLLDRLAFFPHGSVPLVIEQIASYGMAVGAEIFETVFWSGRFAQAHVDWHRMPRKDVKLHLCGSLRAKDSNIRMALIDRFGGKEKAIGRKAAPGPLFGIKADCWQALALGVAWHDLNCGDQSSASKTGSRCPITGA